MIADERARERHPLIGARGLRLLERLREHPDAPRFNHETGDRLRPEDLPALDRLREASEGHINADLWRDAPDPLS